MLKADVGTQITVQIIPKAGHMALFEQPKSVGSFFERHFEPED
jgi:hypothetical protein